MDSMSNEPKKTRREIATPHTHQLTCVSLSHNNRLIAVGSRDNTLSVYNAKTLKLFRRLKGHTGGVYSFCFSNDDKLIAGGSLVGTILVQSVSTGEVTHRLIGHFFRVDNVCFSDDDNYLWSEDRWLNTRVFEMISKKCVSLEKPLWALKNIKERGKSTDGRIEYSFETGDRSAGHKIIIGVVEEDKESGTSRETSSPPSKVRTLIYFFY
jgi:hypothetical protein